MCPELEQLPAYIRRKVANISAPILLRAKLITGKPGCPDVPGSTQADLCSPSLSAASHPIAFCPAARQIWRSDFKTPPILPCLLGVTGCV